MWAVPHAQTAGAPRSSVPSAGAQEHTSPFLKRNIVLFCRRHGPALEPGACAGILPDGLDPHAASPPTNAAAGAWRRDLKGHLHDGHVNHLPGCLPPPPSTLFPSSSWQHLLQEPGRLALVAHGHTVWVESCPPKRHSLPALTAGLPQLPNLDGGHLPHPALYSKA